MNLTTDRINTSVSKPDRPHSDSPLPAALQVNIPGYHIPGSLNTLTSKALNPIRQWLSGIRVEDSDRARRICQLIPAQCPFERDIQLFGVTLVHIPPLCKLNPLYDQLIDLRFRALCYLADDCGEDITPYI